MRERVHEKKSRRDAVNISESTSHHGAIQKQTSKYVRVISALPPRADIGT